MTGKPGQARVAGGGGFPASPFPLPAGVVLPGVFTSSTLVRQTWFRSSVVPCTTTPAPQEQVRQYPLI